jgi:response regulator RpfG family c-di-GMP phosphodiesterase
MEKIIMIVDDEAIILLALARELRNALGKGCRVETALNAESAFRLMDDLDSEGGELAVVVSDWLMPGMKGDEFLVKVRARYPSIALFLVTGQADDAAIKRAVNEAQVLACVRKPWLSSEIVGLIKSSSEL